jgi:uncharacterized membrane protein
MTRLVLGVLLWSLVHFTPALATNFKQNMVNRFGEDPWKGAVGLLLLVSLYLIISGWITMTPVEPEVLAELFVPPSWGNYAAAVLVLIGFVLFLAPYPPNNFKRLLRHPQLIGMLCWCVGHLAAAGSAREIVLFGGLALWSVLEMILINRRDGEWQRPEQVSVSKDVALVAFGVLVYLVFLYTHHLMFSGTPLM